MRKIERFRVEGKGPLLTSRLFLELSYHDKANVMFTLKDEDHLGYPSLYRLYMEMEDIYEWEFANKYLASYEHWLQICSTKWFSPYIERWRKELELKLRTRALKALMDEAHVGGKQGFAANKFLVEKGWLDPPESGKRGRPKKNKDLPSDLDNRELKDHFERMNVTNYVQQ